jgi:hypothetical protein
MVVQIGDNFGSQLREQNSGVMTPRQENSKTVEH